MQGPCLLSPCNESEHLFVSRPRLTRLDCAKITLTLDRSLLLAARMDGESALCGLADGAGVTRGRLQVNIYPTASMSGSTSHQFQKRQTCQLIWPEHHLPLLPGLFTCPCSAPTLAPRSPPNTARDFAAPHVGRDLLDGGQTPRQVAAQLTLRKRLSDRPCLAKTIVSYCRGGMEWPVLAPLSPT